MIQRYEKTGFNREISVSLSPFMKKCVFFAAAFLFAALSAYASEKGFKVNTVMWPLRTAVSGKQATPAGATGIMELLGKEETLIRLQNAVEKLEQAG